MKRPARPPAAGFGPPHGGLFRLRPEPATPPTEQSAAERHGQRSTAQADARRDAARVIRDFVEALAELDRAAAPPPGPERRP